MKEFLPNSTYHSRYEKYSSSLFHRMRLTYLYRNAIKIINGNEWENPLDRPNPSVLLCGTGSARTSQAFADFLKSQNKNSVINIIDIASYPLIQSEKFLRKEEGVRLVRADATTLPFKDNTFDFIETDFFLQFIPRDKIKVLFKEWSRTLKPGGIVTTRDYVFSQYSIGEKTANFLRKQLIRSLGHSKTGELYYDSLITMLTDAGLQPCVVPITIHNYPIPLAKHIIARKA